MISGVDTRLLRPAEGISRAGTGMNDTHGGIGSPFAALKPGKGSIIVQVG